MKVRFAYSFELPEIYRLRYKIYVEEFGHAARWACHERREAQDHLDDRHAFVVVAVESRKIVGTIRGNLADQSELGDYADVYGIDPGCRGVGIVSGLVLEPRLRGGLTAVRMQTFLFSEARDRGVDTCYFDGPKYLDSIYRRIGAEMVRDHPSEPNYGVPVSVWRLDLSRPETVLAQRAGQSQHESRAVRQAHVVTAPRQNLPLCQ